MESKPHNPTPESDTRVSAPDIPQQRDHTPGTPATADTEAACETDPQALAEKVARDQAAYGQVAIGTFTDVRAELDDFFRRFS